MRRKRRSHSFNFKAKVALGTLNGNGIQAQLAGQFDVHSNQISEWRRQSVGDTEQVFGRGEKPTVDSEYKIKKFHAKVDQLITKRNVIRNKDWKRLTVRKEKDG